MSPVALTPQEHERAVTLAYGDVVRLTLAVSRAELEAAHARADAVIDPSQTGCADLLAETVDVLAAHLDAARERLAAHRADRDAASETLTPPAPARECSCPCGWTLVAEPGDDDDEVHAQIDEHDTHCLL
jgi:hypothetical protein